MKPGTEMDRAIARDVFFCAPAERERRDPIYGTAAGKYWGCPCSNRRHGSGPDAEFRRYSTDNGSAVLVLWRMQELGYPFRVEAGNVHRGRCCVTFEGAGGEQHQGTGVFAEAVCRAALAAKPTWARDPAMRDSTDWYLPDNMQGAMAVAGCLGPEPLGLPAEQALRKTTWNPDGEPGDGPFFTCVACDKATASLPGFTASRAKIAEHLRFNHACIDEFIALAFRSALAIGAE